MKLSSFFILAILALACSSEEPVNDWADPLKGLPDKGPIRFDNPEIGQRSRYVSFTAIQDMVTKNVTFTYDPDTLVLGVTAKESGKWVIREFISKGSQNLASSEEAVVSHLFIDSDSAYFSAPASDHFFSWIFPGLKRAIPLQPVADPAPLNPDCLPFFGYDTKIWSQYTIDYTQHGQTFNHLNDYFDYTEMAGDGLGLMYVYGLPYGIVRWTWVSAWEQNEANGWDLVAE
jgi:hypothetical protein